MNAKSVQRFDEGFNRYQAGEPVAALIPLFTELSQQEPEEQSVWVCLSWLQLLADQPEAAVKSARKAVFLDRDSAQAHINLILGLTDSKQQGVTYHRQQARQLLQQFPDQRPAVLDNFATAQTRRPDWTTAQTLQAELFP
ncbi:M48 family metallopeptidase [Candidatus Cyanaurora vandensis]|uniref:tetratricopeptide repeat protein n=1 Tax=Candidatus Cyanaurora vandensis TaxID=2714958 RepID=UPI00257FF556|nr:hypothetical protein [Candidatus Cyanaurora vandensis]